MNFRNVSSWCIRNPVFPIVLFVGLMLGGLIAFARMQVNNAPDIDFPAAIVVGDPARRRAERDGNAGHAARRSRRSAESTASTKSTARSVEGNSQTFVQFQLGTPTDRAVNDVRNAIAQIRGTLPDGILEPQVTRVDADERADFLCRRADHRHDARAIELVHRQYRRQAPARPARHRRRAERRRRRPDDPRDPRSGARCRRRASPPPRSTSSFAQQHERRRRPRRDRRIRAVGARHRQCRYRISARRRPRLRLPGGRFVKLADLGTVQDSNSEQRSLAKMNGQQVVTFMIQRAKGSSEVTAYDSLWKELKKLEAENPKVKYSEVFTTVDYTKAQYTLGDGGPDRGRDARRPRRPAVPSRHPRDGDFRGRRSRSRRSRPSGS